MTDHGRPTRGTAGASWAALTTLAGRQPRRAVRPLKRKAGKVTMSDEAGPNLDVEIARHVFGEQIGEYATESGAHRFIASHGLSRDVPPFSTDIAAAWNVVVRLRDDGFLVRVQEHPDSFRHDNEGRVAWRSRRAMCLIERVTLGVHQRAGVGYADTPALAICRAALEARPE